MLGIKRRSLHPDRTRGLQLSWSKCLLVISFLSQTRASSSRAIQNSILIFLRLSCGHLSPNSLRAKYSASLMTSGKFTRKADVARVSEVINFSFNRTVSYV